jgi:hypothetical protein
MGREQMRAADGDRQAVARRLREAVDEGRLDLYEYDERLQRAYAADRARLARAAGAGAVVGSADATADHPGATRQWLAETWGTYLAVVAICSAAWLITDMPFLFWLLVWAAGPYGAVLLVQTVSGLIGGEPQRWAANREQRRLADGSGRPGAGDGLPRDTAGSVDRTGAAG